MIATETLAKKSMIIAGRQVPLMVYSFYKTSVDNGTVYDVEDVIATTLHHNPMEHFLHRWDRVILGLAEPMPEKAKQAFFCSKVRDCPAFQVEYLNWKRLSDDDPEKTLDTLRNGRLSLRMPEEKVREDELRGHAGGGRGRQPTPAYPANQETTVATRTDAPAPSGDGGGGSRRGRSRGRSRGGTTQRSASPGVRSSASNGTKGKGKGTGRKMGCMYVLQSTKRVLPTW